MNAIERSQNLMVMLYKEPEKFSRPDLESDARWLAQRVERLTAMIQGLHCHYGAETGKSHPDCGKYAPPCEPCKARSEILTM